MRKRFLIAALVLAVPGTLLVVAMVVEHVRGRIALSTAMRNLRQLSLSLTAKEFKRPPVEGNAAPALLKASEAIKEGAALPNHPPPRRVILPSGRAIIGYQENEWISGTTTSNWDHVSADVATNAPALANIGSALDKPLRNELDFSLAPNLAFTHLIEAKKAASWFAAAAQASLRNGDREAAVAHLIAAVRLPRLVEQDRLLISELVRIAIAAIAQTATWEALQFESWTDQDLARLQAAWESRVGLQSISMAMDGEVVFMQETHRKLRKSHAETVRTLFWADEFAQSAEFGDLAMADEWDALPFGDFLKKQVYARVWRFAWIDQAHARTLREMRAVIAALREGSTTTNVGPVLRLNEDHTRRYASRSGYDKLRFPEPLSEATVGHSLTRAFRSETEAQMTVAVIGLRRYIMRHGRAPSALQELVPDFVASVPMDFMDGKPLKYRATSDGTFVLYSSGENQADDGGSSELREPSKALRNPWERLDVVWPSPALPEEVEAYRAEQKRQSARSE